MIDMIDMIINEYGENLVICCPKCGCDDAHVVRIGSLMGTDEARLYDGTEEIGKVDARRSAVAVDYAGECGHNFRLILQQDKGKNFIEHEEQGSWKSDDGYCPVGF